MKPVPSSVSFSHGGYGVTSIRLPYTWPYTCYCIRIMLSRLGCLTCGHLPALHQNLFLNARLLTHGFLPIFVCTEASTQALLIVFLIRPPYTWHQASSWLHSSCSLIELQLLLIASPLRQLQCSGHAARGPLVPALISCASAPSGR